MTAHDHAEFVEGCFRCDLSRDEVDPPQPTEDDREALADALGANQSDRAEGAPVFAGTVLHPRQAYAIADAILAAGFRRAPAEPAVTDGGVRAALRVWYRSAWGGGWTPEHESRMRAALVAALSTERGEK